MLTKKRRSHTRDRIEKQFHIENRDLRIHFFEGARDLRRCSHSRLQKELYHHVDSTDWS
jgi:hypothetical protein